MKSIYKNKLSQDDGRSLKVDRPPTIIFQIEDLQHFRVDELGCLGHCPLEVGKERRIVESPFRGLFIVPLLYWQTVRNRQPIPMHLEIRRFAGVRVSSGAPISMAEHHSLCWEEQHLQSGGHYSTLCY